ncbi:hypothetical protein ACN6LA_001266, partial [Streptomyces sp. SAS_269]|uniref:hypothetical protein n=1 Tax=Streptomyces sp. SAS_269 TaxID=3412749 RepID=UPI00403D02AC
MAVFALLVPVLLMLMMFALDAFEDLLFPPPPSPPDKTPECAYTPSREPTIESSGGAVIQPDCPKRFVVAAGSVQAELRLPQRLSTRFVVEDYGQ